MRRNHDDRSDIRDFVVGNAFVLDFPTRSFEVEKVVLWKTGLDKKRFDRLPQLVEFVM
jgi:hypothetical protein